LNEKSHPERLSVVIHEETTDYTFGKLFRILRAKLQYSRFDGTLSEPVTRINFARGEAAAVLLYDPDDDAVVLVRQFRYPVYSGLSAEDKRDHPEKAWLLEIAAGVKEDHLDVGDVAHKELLEEAGFKVRGEMRKIATVYPSPGGTSEKITVFLGIADSKSPVAAGGGVVAEGEDTQVVVLPFSEALRRVDAGEVEDAKTILALQWLARIDRSTLQ
jgi:ADP-ribose pyrophosphatase